jgi:hypothetical protein
MFPERLLQKTPDASQQRAACSKMTASPMPGATGEDIGLAHGRSGAGWVAPAQTKFAQGWPKSWDEFGI